MNYVGDYTAGDTVLIYFNTFDSNDPSASVTMTNFVNTDVHIHKGADLTQRNNAAGVTVDVDVDGIAGCHLISIDTSDNTVANFFVPGADYGVRIEGVTVDAATLNPFVGHFSLENRHSAGSMVRTTLATLASQTSFTLTAGSTDDDAYNGCTAVITDIATAVQKCVGIISDYTGATKTVTLAADPGIFTMAAADKIHIFATSALANVYSVGNTAQTANDNGADINAILLDTGTDGVKVGADAISAASIADNAFAAEHFAADAIAAATLATGAISADAFAADAIVAATLATGAITADAFAADAIVAATLATGAISADAFAADAIVAATLATDSITSDALAASAATKIIDDFETQSQADPTGFHVNVKEVNGTAQTANDNGADINAILLDTGTDGVVLGADAITSAKIADNAFSAEHFAADAIASATLATGALTADAFAADALVAATFATDSIAADALAADALAEINAEVVDALATDTYAEPGQGAPAATTTLAAKINYLYKFWRNKKTTDADSLDLYNDAADTVDQRATLSDDATTFTQAEMGTGA